MSNKLTQGQIRFIRSLQQLKFRQKYNQYVVEGDKMCKEALKLMTPKIRFVCATPNWIQNNLTYIRSFPYYETSHNDLKKISSFKTPSEVLLVLDKNEVRIPLEYFNQFLCFYLDRISDPGNLGTIIRSCDWFGRKPVYLHPECVDHYNPKCIQASMGGIFSVPVIVAEWKDLMNLKEPETPVYGAVLQGVPVKDIVWTRGGLIVIGSESHGIHSSISEDISRPLTIPGNGGGATESLNAAIAMSIVASYIR